jgi:SH3 domain-containing YSC84-like protein 1
MNSTRRQFGIAILGAGAASVLGAPAAFAADQQVTVDRAIGVVENLRSDQAFGNARDLLRRARGVLIVPRLFKGGFFVGGEGGDGVLLVRRGPGGWSEPAFYAIGSASFGFQFGLEKSEVVMFIMTERGLNAVMQDRFKVGAQAGVAVVTLGTGAGVATTGAVGPDIVVWASSSGAYAGVSVEGSIIEPQHDRDREYYGPGVTQHDILFTGRVANPRASALVSALSAVG